MVTFNFDWLVTIQQMFLDASRRRNIHVLRDDALDPRELKRMQDELRLARERMKAEMLHRRYHIS